MLPLRQRVVLGKCGQAFAVAWHLRHRLLDWTVSTEMTELTERRPDSARGSVHVITCSVFGHEPTFFEWPLEPAPTILSLVVITTNINIYFSSL